MKIFLVFLNITLAFSLHLLAATEDRSTIYVDSKNPTSFPKKGEIDNLSISEVPAVKAYKAEKPFLFTHRKSLFFYTGIHYDTEERDYLSPFGFYYNKYLDSLSSYEIGFDIVNGTGRIQLGKKFLTHLGRLRYHMGWQLGITVDADKGLANLVNFKKFFIGGIAGIEYTYNDPHSIRLDSVLFQGTSTTIIQLNLGYVRSW